MIKGLNMFVSQIYSLTLKIESVLSRTPDLNVELYPFIFEINENLKDWLVSKQQL